MEQEETNCAFNEAATGDKSPDGVPTGSGSRSLVPDIPTIIACSGSGKQARDG
jgi:hypothetical protein